MSLSLPSLYKPHAPLSYRPHFPIFPVTPKISFSHFPYASLTLLPCKPRTPLSHRTCATLPPLLLSDLSM
ncbi:hypothetical protein AMTRI_Chr12g268460 [Amborella trichopoda]